VWDLGWGDRGKAIEKAIKATLPKGTDLADNFPVIDHATDTVITSIKSIDLNAGTYQQPEILARRIDQYAGAVANFATKRWAGVTITATENTQRQLIIAVPKGSIGPMQQQVIDSAITRAQKLVQIRIVPF
jgi:filamentous hemagglutinin